jgi:hypothetical protein
LNGTAVVEGDIFHRSLSIEENARFEGSLKREDNAVDVPRTLLQRPAALGDVQTRQPPFWAIANPMGCQAMMNPLTWEHRSLSEFQYRIKNAVENYERVADETELAPPKASHSRTVSSSYWR